MQFEQTSECSYRYAYLHMSFTLPLEINRLQYIKDHIAKLQTNIGVDLGIGTEKLVISTPIQSYDFNSDLYFRIKFNVKLFWELPNAALCEVIRGFKIRVLLQWQFEISNIICQICSNTIYQQEKIARSRIQLTNSLLESN